MAGAAGRPDAGEDADQAEHRGGEGGDLPEKTGCPTYCFEREEPARPDHAGGREDPETASDADDEQIVSIRI